MTSVEHAFDSASRAIEAFTILTGEKRPFSVPILTPSRAAVRNVVGH